MFMEASIILFNSTTQHNPSARLHCITPGTSDIPKDSSPTELSQVTTVAKQLDLTTQPNPVVLKWRYLPTKWGGTPSCCSRSCRL